MKKIIIICCFINAIIICIFSYFMFLKNENEILEMIDVTNLSKSDIMDEFNGFDVEYIYEDSLLNKDVITKTIPSSGELIQKNQKIIIYLSTGETKNIYKNVVNSYYEDYIEYFLELESIGVNVVIENIISDNYPDGVIIYQSKNGEINNNDTLTIKVNYANPLVLIPDFTNKNDSYVIEYFKKYDIEIYFIYNKMNGNSLIYDQSIKPNSLVLNGTIIYIYIAI